MTISLVVLGIAILLSAGAFAYSHYLTSEAAAKSAELERAEAGVSQDTVEGFLRLRDRLSSAESVLSNHITLSQFFDALESLTLTDVKFDGLTITVNPDHSATVKMNGHAATFNALAAQSAAFAKEPRMKQAIFSGISANPKGVVSFSFSAVLDPKLVVLPAQVPSSWTNVAPEAPAATDASTTEAATTTTTTTTASTTVDTSAAPVNVPPPVPPAAGPATTTP
jgi:hypothetical protein